MILKDHTNWQTYEACTTDTCSGVLIGDGIAAVRKNHCRHLDMTPIGAQFGVSVCFLSTKNSLGCCNTTSCA